MDRRIFDLSYWLLLVDRAFRHTWYEENTAEVIARIAKMGLSKPGKKSAARVNGTVSGPLILVSQLSPNARKKAINRRSGGFSRPEKASCSRSFISSSRWIPLAIDSALVRA